jgi:Fe-S-cluster containining protein
MLTGTVPQPEKRLQLSDSFVFSCHKDLACFNKCCRKKHLPLTPFDVLRLKRALNMHSDDFLTEHTVFQLDQDSGFPIISIKMGDDSEALCPFVAPEGCRVYSDRPTACRLYPLGRAAGKSRDQKEWEGFFFALDTPGCLGTEEKKIWTLEEWQKNQELLPYLIMNDKMLDIVFHKKRDRERPLEQHQIQKVMVACYNLDVFRDFVFNTRFKEVYDID